MTRSYTLENWDGKLSASKSPRTSKSTEATDLHSLGAMSVTFSDVKTDEGNRIESFVQGEQNYSQSPSKNPTNDASINQQSTLSPAASTSHIGQNSLLDDTSSASRIQLTRSPTFVPISDSPLHMFSTSARRTTSPSHVSKHDAVEIVSIHSNDTDVEDEHESVDVIQQLLSFSSPAKEFYPIMPVSPPSNGRDSPLFTPPPSDQLLLKHSLSSPEPSVPPRRSNLAYVQVPPLRRSKSAYVWISSLKKVKPAAEDVHVSVRDALQASLQHNYMLDSSSEEEEDTIWVRKRNLNKDGRGSNAVPGPSNHLKSKSLLTVKAKKRSRADSGSLGLQAPAPSKKKIRIDVETIDLTRSDDEENQPPSVTSQADKRRTIPLPPTSTSARELEDASRLTLGVVERVPPQVLLINTRRLHPKWREALIGKQYESQSTFDFEKWRSTQRRRRALFDVLDWSADEGEFSLGGQLTTAFDNPSERSFADEDYPDGETDVWEVKSSRAASPLTSPQLLRPTESGATNPSPKIDLAALFREKNKKIRYQYRPSSVATPSVSARNPSESGFKPPRLPRSVSAKSYTATSTRSSPTPPSSSSRMAALVNSTPTSGVDDANPSDRPLVPSAKALGKRKAIDPSVDARRQHRTTHQDQHSDFHPHFRPPSPLYPPPTYNQHQEGLAPDQTRTLKAAGTGNIFIHSYGPLSPVHLRQQPAQLQPQLHTSHSSSSSHPSSNHDAHAHTSPTDASGGQSSSSAFYQSSAPIPMDVDLSMDIYGESTTRHSQDDYIADSILDELRTDTEAMEQWSAYAFDTVDPTLLLMGGGGDAVMVVDGDVAGAEGEDGEYAISNQSLGMEALGDTYSSAVGSSLTSQKETMRRSLEPVHSSTSSSSSSCPSWPSLNLSSVVAPSPPPPSKHVPRTNTARPGSPIDGVRSSSPSSTPTSAPAVSKPKPETKPNSRSMEEPPIFHGRRKRTVRRPVDMIAITELELDAPFSPSLSDLDYADTRSASRTSRTTPVVESDEEEDEVVVSSGDEDEVDTSEGHRTITVSRPVLPTRTDSFRAFTGKLITVLGKEWPMDHEYKFCHQCRRKTQIYHLQCNACMKVYCVRCLTIRYPDEPRAMELERTSCPACLFFCNCTACCQKRGVQYVSSRGRGQRRGGLRSKLSGNTSVGAGVGPERLTRVQGRKTGAHLPPQSDIELESEIDGGGATPSVVDAGDYCGGAIYGLDGNKIGTSFPQPSLSHFESKSSKTAPILFAALSGRSRQDVNLTSRLPAPSQPPRRLFVGKAQPSWDLGQQARIVELYHQPHHSATHGKRDPQLKMKPKARGRPPNILPKSRAPRLYVGSRCRLFWKTETELAELADLSPLSSISSWGESDEEEGFDIGGAKEVAAVGDDAETVFSVDSLTDKDLKRAIGLSLGACGLRVEDPPATEVSTGLLSEAGIPHG